jgi:hypothetical protein
MDRSSLFCRIQKPSRTRDKPRAIHDLGSGLSVTLSSSICGEQVLVVSYGIHHLDYGSRALSGFVLYLYIR